MRIGTLIFLWRIILLGSVSFAAVSPRFEMGAEAGPYFIKTDELSFGASTPLAFQDFYRTPGQSLRFYSLFRVAGPHAVSLEVETLRNEREFQSGTDTIFNGILFPANQYVFVRSESEAYRLNYIHEASPFQYGVGLFLLRYRRRLTGNSQDTASSAQHLFPHLHFGWEHDLAPRWAFSATGDFILLPGARFEDVFVGMKYEHEGLSVLLRYRILEGWAENERVLYHGPHFALRIAP